MLNGLKILNDYIRESEGLVNEDACVMNSYSNILTGVNKMSDEDVEPERPRIKCDLCGLHFYARGMPMHKFACMKKHPACSFTVNLR